MHYMYATILHQGVLEEDGEDGLNADGGDDDDGDDVDIDDILGDIDEKVGAETKKD